jgi:N-acetylglucosamine malate deacetylase 2
LSALCHTGVDVSLLCFTRGEASTLGDEAGDLGVVRAAELSSAAAVLGLTRTQLLDYPDGKLTSVPLSDLVEHIEHQLTISNADALVVFDEGGVTGHPDHRHATAAALATAGRHHLDVIAWAIPNHVADTLNAEFATTFVGRPPDDIDLIIAVDRALQRKAIACHQSQATENPVLWRRLELLGDAEHLRYLRPLSARERG